MDLNRELLAPPPAPAIGTWGLSDLAASHSLRCDVRQSQPRFSRLDELLGRSDTLQLGEILPGPLYKAGLKLDYVNPGTHAGPTATVVTTEAIQDLRIVTENCKLVDEEPASAVDEKFRLRTGDVLLTVDGGPSVGKVAVVEADWLDEHGPIAFTDSHVVVLRPVGVEPHLLSFLLHSPLGQAQFQKAETGASGQTAVNEDDIRRFRFPEVRDGRAGGPAQRLKQKREELNERRRRVDEEERKAWARFGSELLSEPTDRQK